MDVTKKVNTIQFEVFLTLVFETIYDRIFELVDRDIKWIPKAPKEKC